MSDFKSNLPQDKPGSLSNIDLSQLLKNRVFWIAVGTIAFVAFLAYLDVLDGSIVLIIAFALYFLPALIARKKYNANTVFVINLFFGWTLIGWVIALAMAVSNPPTVQVVQTAAPAQVPTGRACPFCAEEIKPAAVVCKHCGRDLPAD